MLYGWYDDFCYRVGHVRWNMDVLIFYKSFIMILLWHERANENHLDVFLESFLGYLQVFTLWFGWYEDFSYIIYFWAIVSEKKRHCRYFVN